MAPVQSYAVAVADDGDYKITKDYKDGIHKDVNSKSDSTNQRLGQDNLCYRDDGCEQANKGQQVEGNGNAASGFNDQSKSIENQQNPGISATPPPVTPSTLTVVKDLTCPDGFECPPPSDFTMRVTGAPGNGNPSPSSFAGSEKGTTVTLNVGSYNVSEDFEDNASSPLKVVKHFGSDCSGSIETASEGRVCNVTNEFMIKEYLFLSKWGSLGNDSGQFSFPEGVAVNPTTGSVYVADTLNNRIQVFDSSGTFITKFGTFGSSDGQFFNTFGVAVNPLTGSVYAADPGNNRIQVFDSSGAFITKFGTGGNGDGQFNNPTAVAVNPSTGNVYAADSGHDRIQVFFLDP